MSEFLYATLNAAREIIPLLAMREEHLLQAGSKGVGGDISIGADLLCEEIFTKHLSHIGHIDSEESGLIAASAQIKKMDSRTAPTIVLDPLDGSDNYLSNIPYYGASLALCDGTGAVLEAAVVNFCSAQVIYDHSSAPYASRIHIFTQEHSPIVPTHAKCGVFEKAYSYPDIAREFYIHKLKFRSLGASALSLAYALEHNFFLFCGEIRKYDALAGLFLCRNLQIARGADFLLVSQNKQVFGMIERILSKHHIKQI
ncbi:inositol monophosphatase family protein [Helicobacter sp.]|uniref:inositol monophosphatase family protein n=1 Tax=Helicobacter sp. TaxID=218 RepID=UPI0025BA7ED2|nr:inositol monophosphatase family protein [Helicobacter sp.]MBR2495117.1 inositol monophosphatase [Helicobacter sp.]